MRSAAGKDNNGSVYGRIKKYLNAPSYPNIPDMPRWKWALVLPVTVQSIFPVEILYNVFLFMALWSSVDKLYEDHGEHNQGLIDTTRVFVLACFGLPSFFVDIFSVSPPDEARDAVNAFKGPSIYSKTTVTWGAALTVFSQIGYMALSSSDAIPAGKMTQALKSPPWVIDVFIVYLLLFGMVYYSMFSTGKTFEHIDALTQSCTAFIRKLLNSKESIVLDIVRHPLDSLDAFVRYFFVMGDVSVTVMYRMVSALYCVYVLNRDKIVDLGDETTRVLMILSAVSTGLNAYMMRTMKPLEAVNRKVYPPYYNGLSEFSKTFLVNQRSPLAFARGASFGVFLYFFNLAELPASVSGGVVMTVLNLYIRYIQAQSPKKNSESEKKELFQTRAERSSELFNQLIKQEHKGRLAQCITGVNLLTRVARSLVFREFARVLIVEALPKIFGVMPPDSVYAIDALAALGAIIVAENDFQTYEKNLTENIGTLMIKLKLRGEPGAPGCLSLLFTPRDAYPEEMLESMLPIRGPATVQY